MATSRGVMVRDFFIFQLKLVLDGLKDLILFNASFVALIIDLVADPRKGRRFYALLRMGERFDLWLNLYRPARAAERGEAEGDGLFGASPAGAPTFLGQLEQTVRGGDGPGPGPGGDAPKPPETRE